MPGHTADFWYLATIFFHAGGGAVVSAAAEAESFVIFSLIPKAFSPKGSCCQQLHATHLVAKAYSPLTKAQAVPQKILKIFY
jgi:hypothetical protein